VLLSLVYRLLRCLFGLLAVLVRSDLSKEAELLVLRHDGRVNPNWIWIWPVFRDGNEPLGRMTACVTIRPVRSGDRRVT
jgi:hypothetical protein